MINASTLDEISKTFMNLGKIGFYLFFYLHCVACYMWIAIGYNSTDRFYRDTELDHYMNTKG
jgi:hypothetical protein